MRSGVIHTHTHLSCDECSQIRRRNPHQTIRFGNLDHPCCHPVYERGFPASSPQLVCIALRRIRIESACRNTLCTIHSSQWPFWCITKTPEPHNRTNLIGTRWCVRLVLDDDSLTTVSCLQVGWLVGFLDFGKKIDCCRWRRYCVPRKPKYFHSCRFPYEWGRACCTRPPSLIHFPPRVNGEIWPPAGSSALFHTQHTIPPKLAQSEITSQITGIPFG